jgi:hypothetical protein
LVVVAEVVHQEEHGQEVPQLASAYVHAHPSQGMGTLVDVQEVELKYYTITATEDTSVLVTLIGHVCPLVCGQGVLQHVKKFHAHVHHFH